MELSQLSLYMALDNVTGLACVNGVCADVMSRNVKTASPIYLDSFFFFYDDKSKLNRNNEAIF